MTSSEASPDAPVPARRPDVAWVELDEEAVLYDQRAHTVHRLNSAAAVVWEACDGTASRREEITRVIEHAYSGPRGAIEREGAAVTVRFRCLSFLRQSPAEGADAC